MTGQCLPRNQLTSSQREQMLALMQTHFYGVTRGQFERDLEEKNWVILLTEPSGRLRGFSTLLFYGAAVEDQTLSVVYSGDTIVDAGARSEPVLARTWIDSVNRLREQVADHKLYWLLLTSGFRTYRFLSVFWRNFWPRYDQPTPAQSQRLLEALSEERFGPRFDSLTGLVRFEHPQPLREDMVEIPPGRFADPHIVFFAERNPGFRVGDELVCLCELSEENLTPAGRRMVRVRHA